MTPIPQDLVEKVAEVVWQNDSLRATYKPRRILWTEAGELERKQAMSTATAAIQSMIDAGWIKPPDGMIPMWTPDPRKMHVGPSLIDAGWKCPKPAAPSTVTIRDGMPLSEIAKVK